MEHSGRFARSQVEEYVDGELGVSILVTILDPSLPTLTPLSTPRNPRMRRDNVSGVRADVTGADLPSSHSLPVGLLLLPYQATAPSQIPRTYLISSNRHLKAKSQLRGRTVKGRRNVPNLNQFLRYEITDCNRFPSQLHSPKPRRGSANSPIRVASPRNIQKFL